MTTVSVFGGTGFLAGDVAGADTVVNAVPAYVDTGSVTFEAVHEQGAKTLAQEAAAAAGVTRFVRGTACVETGERGQLPAVSNGKSYC